MNERFEKEKRNASVRSCGRCTLIVKDEVKM